MTSKLWNELSDQEQKVYTIGFDAGKQKGALRGFVVGVITGMLIATAAIIVFS